MISIRTQQFGLKNVADYYTLMQQIIIRHLTEALRYTYAYPTED